MIPLNRFFKNPARCWLLTALAVLALLPHATAQSTGAPPQRWLLVFNTSSAMKSRLPAIKTELENLFVSTISGELHNGDSVGVWTFSKKIQPRTFPQFTWTPAFAAAVTSNLVSFLDDQRYLGNSTFAALTPALGRVIDNSDRLTIVIFCDGLDDLKLTPYDAGINQVFHQSQAERKKSNQPFVLVIRTQNGEFIGATVNLPPGNLDVPAFPPMPVTLPAAAPAAPATLSPAPVVAAPRPAVIRAPPLVIIGTNVGTNFDEVRKLTVPAAH